MVYQLYDWYEFWKIFFETHKIDTHCLLINETDEDFITSDSPIINVHKSINENDLAIPTEDQADFFMQSLLN